MTRTLPARKTQRAGPDFEAIWNAIPAPCVVIDEEMRFVSANSAAEHFFGLSGRSLTRRKLTDVCAPDSRTVELAEQARRGALSLTEFAVDLTLFDREPVSVDLRVAQIFDAPGHVLLLIQPRSVATVMGRSLSQHGAQRSLSGLAAMLAHEIKNPLSGISGAAQLLEMNLGDGESDLLQLIHEEVDRIRALLDRMDAFGDSGPPHREPINVHDVLDQARRSAEAGYARHIRFREIYDPSLPPTPADRAQLLQALSNLIKNASEAAPRQGGEVILKTAYRPGVKIAVSGGARESLPLEITVIDNGAGVSEALLPHIFEPFVTSKSAGTGLGLPLVAKIIADHGGVIECQRQGDKTAFRILLPVWTEPAAPEADADEQEESGA